MVTRYCTSYQASVQWFFFLSVNTFYLLFTKCSIDRLQCRSFIKHDSRVVVLITDEEGLLIRPTLPLRRLRASFQLPYGTIPFGGVNHGRDLLNYKKGISRGRRDRHLPSVIGYTSQIEWNYFDFVLVNTWNPVFFSVQKFDYCAPFFTALLILIGSLANSKLKSEEAVLIQLMVSQ